MNRRLFKPALALVMAVLLVAAGFIQRGLNRDRETMGLNRYVELKGAPPVLALTTVALGGFRGLIANALWIRAMDLQEQDKFFEKVQLADWIVKLEPHYTHVWTVQAWDMAYNISVKFSDPADRWRWVRAGIVLLRDEGIHYNPDAVLLYRELSWFFQHKMGANLDDANMFYRRAWAEEMSPLLGTNYVDLINPQTDEQKERAKVLREEYKMDPAFMQELDAKYGPLEWRLPESHAIYWAALGKVKAANNGEDLMPLRRSIYQSMQTAVMRGGFDFDKLSGNIVIGPNLDMSANANATYEEMMAEDAENRPNIQTGHKNFLRRLPFYLYTAGRTSEAAHWFKVLKEKYPDAVRPGMTLEDYVVSRVAEVASETNVDQSRLIIENYLGLAFIEMATGDQDRAANYERIAHAMWARHNSELGGGAAFVRVGLPDFDVMKRTVLEKMTGPDSRLRPELLAHLRAFYRVPVPAPATGTNAPAISQ
jgi:hypothetical protein